MHSAAPRLRRRMERQPRSPVEQQDSSLAHSIELQGPDSDLSPKYICSANPIAIDPDETSRGSVPQGLAAIGWTLEDWTKLLDDVEAKLRELAWPCWARVLVGLLVLGGIGVGVALAATSDAGFEDGPPIVSIVMFVVALVIFLATCKCTSSLRDCSVHKLLLFFIRQASAAQTASPSPSSRAACRRSRRRTAARCGTSNAQYITGTATTRPKRFIGMCT